MRKNQGFVLAKLLPLILLLGAVVITGIILGQRTGWFNRAANSPETPPIASPWQFAAKLFGVNNSLEYGYLDGNYGGLDLNTFTFETWVKLDPSFDESQIRSLLTALGVENVSPLHIYIAKLPNVSDRVLVVTATGKDNVHYRAEGTTNIPSSKWAHIAVVKDNSEIRTYLNGRLESKTQMATGVRTFPSGIIFGAHKQSHNSFQNNNLMGELDELVLSKSVLYTKDFTPPTTPYTVPPADTIFLLHFDSESQGQYGGWYTTPNKGNGAPVSLVGRVGLLPSTVPYTTPTFTPTPVPTAITPKPTVIIPKNLLQNPSFEIGIHSPSAGGWTTKNTESNDRKQAQQFLSTDGKHVWKFASDNSSLQETLSQQVNYPGQTNDGIVFTIDSYSTSQNTVSQLGAVIIAKYNNGTVAKSSVTFPTAPGTWEQNTISFRVIQPYSAIKVVLFQKTQKSPEVVITFLDNAKLTIQPNAPPSFIQTTSSLTPTQLADFN